MNIPSEYNHKAVLLDTCVLIEISKGRQEMRPFLSALKAANLTPCITDAIYFEFTAHARSLREQIELDEIVRNFEILPSRKEDMECAIELSRLCAHNGHGKYNGISYADFLISAQLVRYKKGIILATLNVADFPTIIFDRIAVHAYDLKDRIAAIGLVAYNEQKIGSLRGEYAKAMEAEVRRSIKQ